LSARFIIFLFKNEKKLSVKELFFFSFKRRQLAIKRVKKKITTEALRLLTANRQHSCCCAREIEKKKTESDIKKIKKKLARPYGIEFLFVDFYALFFHSI